MSKPKLYVKEGCPWCIDALAYFKTKSMELEIIDVRNDPSRMPELIEISGQSKTPTLQNGEFIVADFDIDEFEEAMSKNPEEAKNLGRQKSRESLRPPTRTRSLSRPRHHKTF